MEATKTKRRPLNATFPVCLKRQKLCNNVCSNVLKSKNQAASTSKLFYLTLDEFNIRYASLNAYIDARFKTIPIEMVTYNELKQVRFVIQYDINPPSNYWILDTFPNLDKLNVFFYAFPNVTVHELEAALPTLVQTNFASIASSCTQCIFSKLLLDIKFGVQYLVMLESDDKALFYKVLMVLSKETITYKINWTECSTSMLDLSSKMNWKFKLKIVIPSISLDSMTMYRVNQWSYHLSKQLLKNGYKLCPISGGCYFKLTGYAEHLCIHYPRCRRKHDQIENYIKKHNLETKALMKISIGCRIKPYPKLIDACFEDALHNEILQIIQTKARGFWIDDSKSYRYKLHWGLVYYLYAGNHSKRDCFGLRLMPSRAPLTPILSEIVSNMGLCNFSRQRYHIGINPYYNNKTIEATSSIHSHNEQCKFASLKTITFGKNTRLCINSWIGGSNSLFCVELIRKIIYEFKMTELTMEQPQKHAIVPKHLVLQPGEYRISIMAREIQPHLLQQLCS